MRCEEVREIAADNLAGAQDAAAEALLREHLVECSACRDEFAELKSLWAEMEHIQVPQMEGLRIRTAVLDAALGSQFHFFRWRFDMRQIVRATAIIVILAGIAAGASLILGKRTETRPSDLAKDTGHVRGLSTAPVTLVEYGDYECPPCANVESVLRPLLEKYPESLRFEFRHFPLTRVHPTALLAAKAAEAAGEQDKYWLMHDRILESQKAWSHGLDAESQFIELAKILGMDADKFRRSLRSAEIEQRILKQAELAQSLGITSTPTFFINGKKVVEAPQTFEAFNELVMAELLRLGRVH